VQIAQAVAAHNLITAVGYHWRFLDTVEEAQELLAANPPALALGYWLDATPPPAWWRKEQQSGGQMVEQTTHIFDLARVLVGDVPVAGWVGRLDRKKRVEDFIRAAAVVHRAYPAVRFAVIGGADAFMPEYADELQTLARDLQLQDVLQFLGDRPDVPRLLAGLDIFTWLSRGEGMPHVIGEAGAAGLPVIATRDNGSEEQITAGVTGLFVPHEAPVAVAKAIEQLILNPDLRAYLGRNLRRKVEREYSVGVVTKRWEALFQEVLAESRTRAAA
jgi:glycosyltransferase involved in cell wall biosynthesis